MTDWDTELARGAQAFRNGARFDHEETAGWKTGFGDAISIEIVAELDADECPRDVGAR